MKGDMNTNGYTGMSAFSIDTIKRMCILRDAYSLGIISPMKAGMWAYRVTCHMPYNCSDPQDRIAFKFITSSGRFVK